MSKSAKRKRRARTPRTPAVESDFGPPERGNHDDVVIDMVRPGDEDTTTRSRARVKNTRDPLALYRKRGHISSEQRDAGRRMRAIAQAAGVEPRVIPKYGGMVGRGSVVSAMAANLDRGSLYDRAMGFVPAACRIAVFAVCVQEEMIALKHMPRLRKGLSRLALNIEALSEPAGDG